MARVIPGRFTASVGGPFVVFIIGMRINNIFAIRKWLPTAFAMSPPLKALFSHSEKGVLGAGRRVAGRSLRGPVPIRGPDAAFDRELAA